MVVVVAVPAVVVDPSDVCEAVGPTVVDGVVNDGVVPDGVPVDCVDVPVPVVNDVVCVVVEVEVDDEKGALVDVIVVPVVGPVQALIVKPVTVVFCTS